MAPDTAAKVVLGAVIIVGLVIVPAQAADTTPILSSCAAPAVTPEPSTPTHTGSGLSQNVTVEVLPGAVITVDGGQITAAMTNTGAPPTVGDTLAVLGDPTPVTGVLRDTALHACWAGADWTPGSWHTYLGPSHDA